MENKEKKALFHPVDIGSVTIDGNLFLAPLAGYTDRAFRSVCLKWGASFSYTEMVSGEALARNSFATEKLMKRADNEKKLAIQIFGPEASIVKRSLAKLLEFNPTVIDLNCGCPVPKVVKNGSGSALMNHPDKIFEIIKLLKEGTNVPISIKVRLGWDSSSINYKEVVDAALSGGVDMISMHARTRSMLYTGKASWEDLKELKEFVASKEKKVAVFGSGDLFSAEDALEMVKKTNVDGVMFARGALGNPFIFSETKNLFLSKEPVTIGFETRVETVLEHLRLLIVDEGEEQACRIMRKHASLYLKGIAHSSQIKQALVTAISYTEYEEILKRALIAHC
ncbi:MAG: tRNA dihydrouridine synthase DusB [Sphaerochaetaceae bacterium]